MITCAPKALASLESENGNPAGPQCEDRLAGLNRAFGDEGAPRGEGCDGKRGGFFVAPPGRCVTNRRLREDDVFLAHPRARPAKRGPRVLAPEAAVFPTHHRMGDDPISGREGRDSLGDFEDNARAVAHRNLGQRQPRVVEPFQDQEVPVVQRSGVKSDQNLARTRLVGAVLLDSEVFGAKPMEHPALHPGSVPSGHSSEAPPVARTGGRCVPQAASVRPHVRGHAFRPDHPGRTAELPRL